MWMGWDGLWDIGMVWFFLFLFLTGFYSWEVCDGMALFRGEGLKHNLSNLLRLSARFLYRNIRYVAGKSAEKNTVDSRSRRKGKARETELRGRRNRI